MRYFGLLLVAAFLFLSCSKEEIQAEENKSADEFFYAKVNDKKFLSPKVLSSNLVLSSSDNSYVLEIYAENNSGETINISVSDYFGPNAYYLGEDQLQNYGAYGNSGTTWRTESSLGRIGLVTIKEESETYMTGNFYFRVCDIADPVDLKDIRGEFKVYPVKSTQ